LEEEIRRDGKESRKTRQLSPLALTASSCHRSFFHSPTANQMKPKIVATMNAGSMTLNLPLARSIFLMLMASRMNALKQKWQRKTTVELRAEARKRVKRELTRCCKRQEAQRDLGGRDEGRRDRWRGSGRGSERTRDEVRLSSSPVERGEKSGESSRHRL